MSYVLGIDAGATKTLAMIADYQGNILGTSKAGTGNFQVNGIKAASLEVNKAIDGAIEVAGIKRENITAAFYGMAGADRDKDFEYVHQVVEPINPAPKMAIENDAVIILKVGALDGVGVGVVCGTGTNCIGFNKRGDRLQVGGLGELFGDSAGAGYIGTRAFRAAVRGFEGRGPKTVLYEMFCKEIGVDRLIDIVEFFYPGSTHPGVDFSRLTPLVFEAANKEDQVALDLLSFVGEEMGLAVNTAIKNLYSKDEHVKVVIGGSVAQKGNHPAMLDAFKAKISSFHPDNEVIVPTLEPAFGAIFYAYDLVNVPITDEVIANLEKSFKR
ncbi:MAG: BadF/BadG/BcrA/BcrD ATPase family protein [Firmicutes bacterium]|nr:BadF/BadG/BcrA/BcrD ATPase family protein [Bacillota bacterium]MDD4264715.1 BadF/BadG/BcrA/BcrD ATPase family protein [Bacillota bacterium]MDD4693283.1 BadF/BadG/BcrA/BcrD ATPase family protein [Bacillota bacterium]